MFELLKFDCSKLESENFGLAILGSFNLAQSALLYFKTEIIYTYALRSYELNNSAIFGLIFPKNCYSFFFFFKFPYGNRTVRLAGVVLSETRTMRNIATTFE